MIVFGTSFSPLARKASAGAAAIARRLGENLCLAHVTAPDPGDQAGATVGERLAREAESLRDAFPGLEVQTEVRAGDPAERLAELASEMDARLVVVASHGHAERPLWRATGLSEELAVVARSPLLVLREGAAFVDWAAGERPLRVLLGLDGEAAGDAALAWVGELRRAGPCDVTVARVYSLPAARRRLGLAPTSGAGGSALDPDPEVERLLERELAERVRELPGEGAVELRPWLGLGRSGDHLLHLAELEEADLVAVGHRRHRGLGRLGSVAEVVLHFGEMSVALIPPGTPAAPADVGVPVLRRVLAATDLSPLGDGTIPYAYALVGETPGAEVYLLHVHEGSEERRRAEVVAALRRRMPAAAGRGDVATFTEAAAGDAAEEICAAADRLGVDAVCVASHGRSGLRRAALGSVAEAVLRRSRRPVLVVCTSDAAGR